ncbi:MAG: hypothetical protein KDK12_17355 [Rhodobacteraceae bacterium]|nr:hypothetical protein [Paracoccaceae bacterium]
MTRTISRLASLIALLFALATLSAGEASAERFSFRELPPALRAVIAERLQAQGLRVMPETLSVAVTVANCPPICAGRVLGGMCYCERPTGGCPVGTEEAELGGEEMCKIAPTRVMVGGGSLDSVRTLEILAP